MFYMKERIRKWLEPLGLILLLVAFGWQCLAEHSKQVKYEGYIYEMSQKLDAIWLGVYDEVELQTNLRQKVKLHY